MYLLYLKGHIIRCLAIFVNHTLRCVKISIAVHEYSADSFDVFIQISANIVNVLLQQDDRLIQGIVRNGKFAGKTEVPNKNSDLFWDTHRIAGESI